MPAAYLEDLKSSEERCIANESIHPSIEDDEYARIMWNSLSKQLSGAELLKYRELMRFGRGFSAVKYEEKS